MQGSGNAPAVREAAVRYLAFALYLSVIAPVTARGAETTRPCATLPEARQLDFWVGRWEVRDTKGQIAGTNDIQKILGGCALLENWTGARGLTGKSLNTFDRRKGKWQQIWVDDRGDVLEFVDGEFKDGVMRFRAETREPGGEVVLRRLSFQSLGKDKVRQMSVQSQDGGKTWTTEYDLTYTRIR